MSQESLYPLEFQIAGTPISLQAKSRASRERWKSEVKAAASQEAKKIEFFILDDRPVSLTIYYFTSAPMQGDVDNIVKPIMDALEAVAYLSDGAVERVIVQKFEPAVDWTIGGISEQLAAAVECERPVVYVRVDDDLSWRTLS